MYNNGFGQNYRRVGWHPQPRQASPNQRGRNFNDNNDRNDRYNDWQNDLRRSRDDDRPRGGNAGSNYNGAANGEPVRPKWFQKDEYKGIKGIAKTGAMELLVDIGLVDPHAQAPYHQGGQSRQSYRPADRYAQAAEPMIPASAVTELLKTSAALMDRLECFDKGNGHHRGKATRNKRPNNAVDRAAARPTDSISTLSDSSDVQIVPNQRPQPPAPATAVDFKKAVDEGADPIIKLPVNAKQLSDLKAATSQAGVVSVLNSIAPDTAEGKDKLFTVFKALNPKDRDDLWEDLSRANMVNLLAKQIRRQIDTVTGSPAKASGRAADINN